MHWRHQWGARSTLQDWEWDWLLSDLLLLPLGLLLSPPLEGWSLFCNKGLVPAERFRSDELPCSSPIGVGMSIGERGGGGRVVGGSLGDTGGCKGPGWEKGVFLDRCFLLARCSQAVTQCPAPLQ